MKRLILSAALLGVGVANAQTANYTLADVAKHATATDCWMVLNSKVYNVTAFIPMHPGGNIMVASCGKDGTAAFNGVPHSSNAVALEAPYLIGTLVSTAPASISVQLAPTNAAVNVGATVQFTPTVTNSTSGVAWTVSPSSLGTISSSGLFTAVSAGGGTITATSMQDTTKSASASITVSATPPPPAHTITVTITPSALSLNVGAKAQFTATLTNSTQGVTWSATKSIGTIDKNGVLTAAMTPGTGTVTATSVDDPTKSHSVQVTVTPVQCAPAQGGGGHDRDDDTGAGSNTHRHDD